MNNPLDIEFTNFKEFTRILSSKEMESKIGFHFSKPMFQAGRKISTELGKAQKFSLKQQVKQHAGSKRNTKFNQMLKLFYRVDTPKRKTWNKGDGIYRVDVVDRNKFGDIQEKLNFTGRPNLSPDWNYKTVPVRALRGPANHKNKKKFIIRLASGKNAIFVRQSKKKMYMIATQSTTISAKLSPFKFLSKVENAATSQSIVNKATNTSIKNMIKDVNKGRP